MRRLAQLPSVFTTTLFEVLPKTNIKRASQSAGEGSDGNIAYELLTTVSSIHLPSIADLNVLRIRLDVGATSPLQLDDPTSGILLVESGLITVRADVPLWVTRQTVSADAASTTSSVPLSSLGYIYRTAASSPVALL